MARRTGATNMADRTVNMTLSTRELQLLEWSLGKRVDALHAEANKEDAKKRGKDILKVEQLRLLAKEVGEVQRRVISANP
jgi:hypothetical protein